MLPLKLMLYIIILSVIRALAIFFSLILMVFALASLFLWDTPALAFLTIPALLLIYLNHKIVQYVQIIKGKPKTSLKIYKVILYCFILFYFVLDIILNERLHEVPHTRLKIGDALAQASQCKTLLQEYYDLNKIFPNSLNEFDCPRSGEFVKIIETDGQGGIIITMKEEKVPKEVTGKTLIVTPLVENGEITKWSCLGGTIPDKYRPKVCRKK